MKRMKVSLPVAIWTFIIISGCVGSQVAKEVQLGRNALQTGQPQVALDIFAMRLSPILTTRLPTQSARAYGLIWAAPTTRSAIFPKLSGHSKRPYPKTRMIPSQDSISV